jgi:hypothetical protein
VSFIAGLVWGLVIALIEVASEHYGPSFGAIAFNGNGAIAVHWILIPLAIFSAWTWITNRWSGRSFIPGIAFAAGLYLGVGTVVPVDSLLFPQGSGSTLANSLPALLATGALLVVPPVLIAAAIYWVLRSERFPANAFVIVVLYLIGLAIATAPLVGPILAGGVIAGTAAGHSWRAAGARMPIGILVIILMTVAVIAIPYVLAGGGKLEPPTFPNLTPPRLPGS